MIPIRVHSAECDEFRDDILPPTIAKSMPVIMRVTMPVLTPVLTPVFWGEAVYKG